MSDPRLFSPSAERNREPIAKVLADWLSGPAQDPDGRLVLEIASGSGQHALAFAERMPALVWQPSDPDAAALASIAARIEASGASNLRAPLSLDVHRQPWPLARADAIVCCNMIHIAPWSATLALFAGGASILPTGAPVCLYGPYRRGGRHTAPSNASFDASLRARDPGWGVRDLEAVEAVARDAGLHLVELREMPANNLMLRFERD